MNSIKIKLSFMEKGFAKTKFASIKKVINFRIIKRGIFHKLIKNWKKKKDKAKKDGMNNIKNELIKLFNKQTNQIKLMKEGLSMY